MPEGPILLAWRLSMKQKCFLREPILQFVFASGSSVQMCLSLLVFYSNVSTHKIQKETGMFKSTMSSNSILIQSLRSHHLYMQSTASTQEPMHCSLGDLPLQNYFCGLEKLKFFKFYFSQRSKLCEGK